MLCFRDGGFSHSGGDSEGLVSGREREKGGGERPRRLGDEGQEVGYRPASRSRYRR